MNDEKAAPQVAQLASEEFDVQFRAQAKSRLSSELWARAWGEEYPTEIEPFSSCSWSMLGEMVSAFKLSPGGRLVDLGCGTGGVGLWLARAFGAHLVGVDFSAAAVELARSRAAHWLPDGMVEFRVGTLDGSGLPESYADAVASLDALPLGPDIEASLAELRRILRPGGRAAFTASEPVLCNDDQSSSVSSWDALLRQAGLEVECRHEHPEVADQWRVLYELVRSHQHELRAEMGDRPTDNLLAEAQTVGPSLHQLHWFLFVVSRPL